MTAITAGTPSSNFFLDGNFSPVHEERDTEDMEVINQHADMVHNSPITIPRSILMHDFAATEKYTLFLDFPITLDVGRAIAGGPAVDFEPQYGSRIGVMPRYGCHEDVRWFDVETGVVIHTANP